MSREPSELWFARTGLQCKRSFPVPAAPAFDAGRRTCPARPEPKIDLTPILARVPQPIQCRRYGRPFSWRHFNTAPEVSLIESEAARATIGTNVACEPLADYLGSIAGFRSVSAASFFTFAKGPRSKRGLLGTVMFLAAMQAAAVPISLDFEGEIS